MSSRVRLIVVLSFVGGLGLVLSVGATLYSCGWKIGVSLCSCDDWMGFFLNLGTELVGAALTYFLFSRFIEHIQGLEAEKAELIRQMGSSIKDVAVAAADRLGQRGWLYDGSVRRKRLYLANLEGANLWMADLEGADLRRANLEKAILPWTNLKGADLQEANLKRVDLRDADLEGVDLRGADLEGATLPDGTEWTPDTDMVRFTDPHYPNFWRSDDPDSPAYRGKASD
jgi:hypothetical protein